MLLLVPLAAHAASPTGVTRVAVRVADPTSRGLMQRVRGQTSDLTVALIEATEPALESRVGDQVATAERLGRQLDARVVIWFEDGASGLSLFFALPDEQRTLVRTLAEDASARSTPSSATFESAALVIRSVLRALASGATIGVTLAAPLDVLAPNAASASKPSPIPPPPPEPLARERNT